MALDFTIADEYGDLTNQVALGVDEHWKLVEAATPADQFPMISRFRDYYEDASFTFQEMTALRTELERIRQRANVSVAAIEGLLRLCSDAVAKGRGIEAIAD
jgi:hypothetical protein